MFRSLILAGIVFSVTQFGFEAKAGTNDIREAQIQGTLMQIFPDGSHRHWPDDYVHPKPKDPEPFEWILDFEKKDSTGFDNSILKRLKENLIKDLQLSNIFITSYFDFDKAELKQGTKNALLDYVSYLKENNVVKVKVYGHADTMGTKNYNYVLGYKRALAVYQFIVENGVNAEFEVKSFGENNPAIDFGDEYKSVLNRRVVITGIFSN